MFDSAFEKIVALAGAIGTLTFGTIAFLDDTDNRNLAANQQTSDRVKTGMDALQVALDGVRTAIEQLDPEDTDSDQIRQAATQLVELSTDVIQSGGQASGESPVYIMTDGFFEIHEGEGEIINVQGKTIALGITNAMPSSSSPIIDGVRLDRQYYPIRVDLEGIPGCDLLIKRDEEQSYRTVLAMISCD